MTLSLKGNAWIGVGLFILSFILRLAALLQTDYANGWDGYYYVMQSHSLIEYGHMQSLDYSLIYPYFTLLSLLINDYVLAVKVGSALLAAVLSFLIYTIVTKVSSNRYLGLLGASFSLFSPGITFITASFPKNLLGIIFLLLMVVFLTQRKFLLATLFLILSLLTHRMTAGLGLLAFGIILLPSFNIKYLIIAILGLVAFSFLPGIFHWSDLERFNGVFTALPQLSPLSFYQLNITHNNTYWIIELFILTSIICYLIRLLYTEWKTIFKNKSLQLYWIFSLIFFFPFFEFDFGSMGFRFFLVSSISAPFILLFVSKKISNTILLSLSILFIASSFISYKSYNPKYHDAPNETYFRITEGLVKNFTAEEYTLVIAHKSLAEVIIYKTDFDALNWAKPEDIELEKVLRIVHGVPKVSMIEYLSSEEINKLIQVENQYYILPESLWLKAYQKAANANDVKFLTLVSKGNNPMTERPDYLLKGKNDE
ncbi:EpsG family protein [Fulvivirga lutea]|uniref:EpsG family protein n=1 Tax=Fulvivirga lutea TaxID=2810512 RepID=A0A974WPC6_9BACT|nr:EpsG family protein [Fulvivirga lutea]QSE99183.1 EpsG family protein [Fulvivirga lutea]